jgi:hypothetical protein
LTIWAAMSNGCNWPVSDIHRANLNGCSRDEADGRLRRAYDREGSIAPVQFLNLRPFDQLLMLAGAVNLWPAALEIRSP